MTATTAYLITLALILGGRFLYQLGYIHGTRRRDERIARHRAGQQREGVSWM